MTYSIEKISAFVAKRIVREFSHLMWGLFDEDIPVTDKESSRFYPKNGVLTPVGYVFCIFKPQLAIISEFVLVLLRTFMAYLTSRISTAEMSLANFKRDSLSGLDKQIQKTS